MTTHITKTWFDGDKVVTQEIPESEVYKQEPVAWRWKELVNGDFVSDWILDAGFEGGPKRQEPVAWKNAAIRLGEELSSVGPDGYYDMNAEQWLTWAMDQQPRGKNSQWRALKLICPL